MIPDLSERHKAITNLFKSSLRSDASDQFCLNDDQIAFFHTNGYLAGIRVLNDQQIEALRAELSGLIDPNHPGHDLFYEFHANESTDPGTVGRAAVGRRASDSRGKED